MAIVTFINKINGLGIKLWLEEGQLRFKAPKGVWNNSIRDELVANKQQVINYLHQQSEQDQIPPILPVPRTDEQGKPINGFPLSYVQERLWFIDQLEPNSAGYNIPKAVLFKGPLNVAHMEQAFNLIIARHENLRTVFRGENSEPQQVVLDELDFKLSPVDLSHYATDQLRHEKARQLCEEEAALPFNLATGPLIRGKLLKLGNMEHILILNMHHIITDAWSTGVFIREFGIIMESLAFGKIPALAPLSVQYIDYSVWQRKMLGEGGLLEEQLAYWQKKLKDVPESLNLATDFPRPSIQSLSGARHAFKLSAELSSQLQKLSDKQGCTLFITILAIFKTLLYRYTGQQDICLGSPVANRQYAETQGLIGMFVNTLALRNQISGDMAFNSFLAQVKNTCLEAYENQDAPFEKIVDLVQPKRNMAINPIFQIMIDVQKAQKDAQNQHIQSYPFKSETSKFDLGFGFIESADGLDGQIEYSTALFKPETIARLAQHFEALCRAVVSEPDTRISDLQYLAEAEKQQLLVDFNHSQNDFAAKNDFAVDSCVHQRFVEQVKAKPNNTAVVFDGESLSYQELYDKSHKLALYLEAKGVGPDSLVALCVERSLDMLVGLLGILQAGGAYVPVDTDYPADRIAWILEDTNASIVLTQMDYLNKLSGLHNDAQIIALDNLWTEIGQWSKIETDANEQLASQTALKSEVTPQHLAYVVYTSGSTGKPKGVMVEHQGVNNTVNWFIEHFKVSDASRLLMLTDFTFDPSVEDIFGALTTGGTLHIPSKELLLNEKQLANYIYEHSITGLNFVPTMLHGLLCHHQKLNSIEFVISGGEKLAENIKHDILARGYNLHNNYGPTEITIDVLSAKCTEGQVVIGKPVSNAQAYILDEFNHPVPVGIPGELHIAGAGVARGYLNRDELTQEKFVANPFVEGSRMYKTGDLVRWLQDGNVEYLGRIDTQVKVRGFRIETGEIEAQLNLIDGISDSAVVAQGAEGNKHLVAFYVLAQNAKELKQEALKAELSQSLPDYMLPGALMALEAIPLTSNGKVDRRKLEATNVTIESDEIWVAPRNPKEKQLAAIWADVLGIAPEKIGIKDNFFALGGDSIKTIQVVSRAIEQQIHFDVRDMFSYQSIEALLLNCDTSKSKEIIKEEGILEGAVRLSPIQSDFFNHTKTDLHHYNQSVLLNLNVQLSKDSLQEIVTKLLEQHDALRLRYSSVSGSWQQHYQGQIKASDNGIEHIDISAVEYEQLADFVTVTCNQWQASLDIENGPTMRWLWFDGNDNQQLAIIVHHLMIDGVSWRILLEDLNQLLEQTVNHKPLKLAKKRSSYRNWVDSLEGYIDSEQGQKDLLYWQEQGEQTAELSQPFSTDEHYCVADIQHHKVELSKGHTEKLLKHCHQAYGTDINDLLLTAVMLSYHKATGNARLVLDLEGHGREQLSSEIDITKTLGWFTSVYPVQFALSRPDDVGQSIKEVKTALNAIPGKGIGYSIFRHINRDEAVCSIPESQVIFNFLGDFQSQNNGDADIHFSLSKNDSGVGSSPRKEVDKLVTIHGLVAFEQLTFNFGYPQQWQGQPVSQWQHHFISSLESLIDHCFEQSRLGYTPDDFPLLPASLAQLDELIPTLEQQQQIPLNNVQDIYPLTPLQSGILFETLFAQTQENKGMYLTQSAIGINAEVDLSILQQAWQAVINHYDVLRMKLVTDNLGDISAGIQVILKNAQSLVNCVDWSDKNDAELRDACQLWMQESKLEGISFEQPSLMRMTLFKGQSSSYLLFEQHHIVLDGWSQGIVLSNLFKLYLALARGQDYQLPATAAYGAYVERVLNRDEEQEKRYWQDYLSSYEEKTPLPMQYQAPGNEQASKLIARDVFETERFNLSKEASIQLEQLVKNHRLTINTVLQYLWGLMLHLHSGNKAVTFGSVSSGRTGLLDIKHSDQIVGLCINTTPTCIEFDAELTLLEQLKRMQNRESEKLQFEITPLVRIQEILAQMTHQEGQSNQDFFQTLFVFENYPVEQISETDSLIKEYMGNEAPNYPLSVAATSKDSLSITFTWDNFYFSIETISTLIAQFERLTLQLLDNPEAKLKGMMLPSESERQQLLMGFNKTQAYYPKDKCIHQLLKAQVERTPNAIAVVYENDSLSYQQLYERSQTLAVYLQYRGVTPDTLVGLCVERSLDMMTGIFGILMAGGAYVPLDPNYPEERLEYMLADSQVSQVLTQSELQERLGHLIGEETQLIALDTDWSAISDSADNRVLKESVRASNLAYMIYTSGSTGQPKGVMVEHRSLVNHMHWIIGEYGLDGNRTLLQKTSFNFDAAQWEFMVLVGGTKVVMGAPGVEKDPQALIQVIKEQGITTLQCVPSLLKALLMNTGFAACNTLTDIFCGGEALSLNVVEECRTVLPSARVINLYGPTECTIDATAFNCEKRKDGLIPIGKAVSNTQTYILDEHLNPVPMGVPGELHIAGDCLARGYFNRPKLTAEKFINNPFNADSRMYKTGDLVRWLEDGHIDYLGRVDNQVKIRGYRIETGDIEAQLSQLATIKDCAVVVQGEDDQKKLVAFYVAHNSSQASLVELDQSTLKTHLLLQLPEYMLPVAYVSLCSIPLLPNGKTDRKALSRMDVAQNLEQLYVAPRSIKEKQLVAIWADILGMAPENIGINDNFFELGGDSIKIIQVVSKAVEQQIHFDVRDMFKHQSIQALLRNCDTSKSKEIIRETGLLAGELPLSPIQTRFFEQTKTDVHHFNQSVLLDLDTSLSEADLNAIYSRLVEQHDALRLTFSCEATGWHQQYGIGNSSISDTKLDASSRIHRSDISQIASAQIAEHVEGICNHWQSRLDLENGPLMRWVYFAGEGQQQLAIIIHHLAVDGVSWRILLEDLNLLIAQQLAQQPLKLSQKRSSYRNWVDSLSGYVESQQGQQDLDYWINQSESLKGTSNALFSSEVSLRTQDISNHEVSLSKADTQTLLKQCHQAYGTDINDLLLTAVVLSFYESTGQQSLILDMEGHGREQLDPVIDITKTVGWFTSIYPVSLELSSPSDIGQCIKDVKSILRAIPNKGIGFPIFRYIDQHEALKDIPESTVMFNFLGEFQNKDNRTEDAHFSLSDQSTGRGSSKLKEVSQAVTINGVVANEQLSFTFSYPHQWREHQLSQWQTHFVSALQALIAHCANETRLGYTPDDFPLLPASLPQLDDLMSNLSKHQNIPVNNIQDIHPLTPLQSGIWFETLYAKTEENRGMYLTQSAIGINGAVDLVILNQAWRLVVHHYDALRMRLVNDDIADINTGLQVIVKQAECDIAFIDWSEKNHVELKSACELWMQQSKSKGIDFHQSTPMRMSLFKGQASSYLLFEQHHIMLDGWSQSIVLTNLFRLYQSLMQKQDYSLPATAPYGHYVQMVLERNQQAEAAFWKSYLQPFEEKTPLPLSQGNGKALTSDIAEKTQFDTADLCFTQAQTQQLEKLVKSHRLTMNTALQYLWGLMLHLHSGNQTVAFGSVSSGRTGLMDVKHSDQIVGLCINTTPTCIEFDNELSLLEQLQRMQGRESEKLTYEVTPLTQIQEFVGNGNGEELFQTLFVYENYPVDKVSEANNLICDFIGNEAPGYPLSVVAATSDTLAVSFTWDNYHYHKDTIDILVQQFERLTLQLLAAPDAPVSQLTLLTEAQRVQVLTDFNATEALYPQDKCIHELFREQVKANPDKVAVVYEDESLSYQQLFERSQTLALVLQAQGVKPDTMVALCMERSLEMMVAILAILQAGGAYVPLDPDYPDERLTYMLKDCDTSLVLTQGSLSEKLSEVVSTDTRLMALDTEWQDIAQQSVELSGKGITLNQDANAEHLAYVIYTSGSTGLPKGVMVSHKAVNRLVINSNFITISPEDTFLQFASLSFDAATLEIWGPLLNGAKLAIASRGKDAVNRIGDLISQHKISVLWLTSGLFQSLMKEDAHKLAGLRVLLSGGDVVPVDTARKYLKYNPNSIFINGYGPTESTTFTSCYGVSNGIKEELTTLPIGTPIANTQVYILDQNRQPVPIGVPGELYIAGDGLARGYLNQPALTAEKFVDNPFDADTRMYRSGDLACWQADGNIVYLGRIDNQVKIRGFRIETGEIETQLKQHPDVKDAVVVAKGETGNRRLVAFLVSNHSLENEPGNTPVHISNESLKNHLQQRLPEHMLPAVFECLPEIPLTANGKVDRRKLSSLEVNAQADAEYIAPRNDTERHLVAIWSELLSIAPENIGIHDSFFELGGNSLLATQVISKIRTQMAVEVPMKALFNANTIEDIAELIQAIDGQLNKPAVDIDTEETEFEDFSL